MNYYSVKENKKKRDIPLPGSPTDRGMSFRSMHHIFELIRQRAPQFKYQVDVSLFEIYNDQVR